MPICTKCNDVCSKKHEPQRAAQKRAYYEANKERITERRKLHYEANKDRVLAQTKDYDSKNKEKKAAQKKNYVANNKEKVRESSRQYLKNKRKTDHLYNMSHKVRRRLREVLANNNWNKTSSFNQYIGCSNSEFIAHIESLFIEDMNWDNQSLWHLDHIMPISTAKTTEELYELCHYLNIQPLWKSDNLKKSNKITEASHKALENVRKARGIL